MSTVEVAIPVPVAGATSRNGYIVSMSSFAGEPPYGNDSQPAGPAGSLKKMFAPFTCEWPRLIEWPNSCVITPAKAEPSVSAGSMAAPLRITQLSVISGVPSTPISGEAIPRTLGGAPKKSLSTVPSVS